MFFVYIDVHVHICMYICIRVFCIIMYISIYTFIYIYIYKCKHVYLYMCIFLLTSYLFINKRLFKYMFIYSLFTYLLTCNQPKPCPQVSAWPLASSGVPEVYAWNLASSYRFFSLGNRWFFWTRGRTSTSPVTNTWLEVVYSCQHVPQIDGQKNVLQECQVHARWNEGMYAR